MVLSILEHGIPSFQSSSLSLSDQFILLAKEEFIEGDYIYSEDSKELMDTNSTKLKLLQLERERAYQDL